VRALGTNPTHYLFISRSLESDLLSFVGDYDRSLFASYFFELSVENLTPRPSVFPSGIFSTFLARFTSIVIHQGSLLPFSRLSRGRRVAALFNIISRFDCPPRIFALPPFIWGKACGRTTRFYSKPIFPGAVHLLTAPFVDGYSCLLTGFAFCWFSLPVFFLASLLRPKATLVQTSRRSFLLPADTSPFEPQLPLPPVC